MLLLLVPLLRAASLDNLEIGGPWGTPLSTDGTAGWWNPAGLAAGHGTRIFAEGAPTIAKIVFDRSGDHGGEDVLNLTGVVPYFGLATDAGVKGMGLGLTLAVPFARGGDEANEPGSGSYHLRSGMVQGFYLMAGGGWNFLDRVSVGGMVGVLHSSWTARLDNDTMILLNDQIKEMGQDPGYTDADLENPDYKATLSFGNLSGSAFAWSAGIRVRPVDRLTLGVAVISGGHINNTGRTEIAFGCPPQSDTTGRFGAESFGICDTTLTAGAAVAYDLPMRVQGGVGVALTPMTELQLMGGWVQWSVFKDYDITISGVEDYNELKKPETADVVNQHRLWARENHDSGWMAADIKGQLSNFTLGGRVTYDLAAVPDEALSPNNYDANELIFSGLVAYKPVKYLTFGLSGSYHLVSTRTVQNSGFGVTLDTANRKEDRWFYTDSNGTYSGSILRFGVQAKAEF